MARKILAIFASLVVTSFGLLPSANATESQNPESLIVKSSVENPAELKLFRGQQLEELAPNTYILSLPSSLSFDRAEQAYLKLDHVEYVEPNLPVEVETADDTEYVAGNMWGVESGFGTNAESAWANGFTGSDSVYVAVIDSGIDYTHPDLASNMWTNSGEIAGNGIDDDGNGFIDDVHGYDFLNDDGSIKDNAENPHGTHVAGTIGAVGNNGIGVTGVAQNVKLISAKISNPDGTSSVSNAIRAIDYITQLRTQKGLDIIATNNSWGGVGYSKALEEAIQRGGDAGIIFVAAAGNSAANNDGSEQFPGNLDCSTEIRDWDCLVTVAALDEDGSLADYSNYGSTSVDIAAPGTDILSTKFGGGYELLSGTSMAAPHVTGALALCVAANRGTGGERAISNLFATASSTASVSGKVATGGRVDASALASLCANQSQSFSGTPSEHLATALYTDTGKLEWTDSVSGEFEFKIEYHEGPDGCRGTFQHLAYIGPELDSYPLTGLTESEFYCFRIKAMRGGQNSSWETSNVMITWTSNLPFIGGTVYLNDGVTPVSGIEMNWLPASTSIATGGRDAVSVVTDKNGDFLLQVPNGQAGQLYAETSRSPRSADPTDPLTPWGLVAKGELTIENDTSVNFKLPKQKILTFTLTEEETGNPISGAMLRFPKMAEYCDDNSIQPFPTATNTDCWFWPAGYSSSGPSTDANGKVSIAIIDKEHGSRWPENWQFTLQDPSTGAINDITLNPYESDENISVVQKSSVTISGVVTLEDGTTPVENIEMNWLPTGSSISSYDRIAVNTLTDENGQYSLEVSPDVSGQLYAQTSRNGRGGSPTTPITPIGMVVEGELTASADTTVDFRLPELNTVTFRVSDEDSGDPIAGAEVKFADMALYCENNAWSPFDGARDTSCNFWPSGFSSQSPSTDANGELKISIIDSQFGPRWPDLLQFNVIDNLSKRSKTVAVDPSVSQTVEVAISSKVSLTGQVFLADGVTPVSGIEMNWLVDSASYVSNDRDALTSVTDSNGNYSFEIPAGTAGQIYAQTSRYANRATKTSPITPWGLLAKADFTVETDTELDFNLPEIDVVTIKVKEWASDEPVSDALVQFEGLADYCDKNVFMPFDGASDTECNFWPTGYSSASPSTDSNGEIQLALLSGSNSGIASSMQFKVSHPDDVSRVKDITIQVQNGEVYEVVMPGTPSQPEQPEATPLTDKVILTWDEPWDGGAFIDYYKVWMSLNDDGPFLPVQAGSCKGEISPSLRACEVEGLQAGTTYYFAIIAHNVYGYSDLSIASMATTKPQTTSEEPSDPEPTPEEEQELEPAPEPEVTEDPESSPDLETDEESSEQDQVTEEETSEEPDTEDEETTETDSTEEQDSTEEESLRTVENLAPGKLLIDGVEQSISAIIAEDKKRLTLTVGSASVIALPSREAKEDSSLETFLGKPSKLLLSNLAPSSEVKVYQSAGSTDEPVMIGYAAADETGSADVDFILWRAEAGDSRNVHVLIEDSSGSELQLSLAATVYQRQTQQTQISDEPMFVWTKRLLDANGNETNQVKMYAKNVVGNGKIQFIVDGEEIAWVRTDDPTNSRLRQALGTQYLVRTIDLEPGKNRLRFYIDGEQVRLNTYSG